MNFSSWEFLFSFLFLVEKYGYVYNVHRFVLLRILVDLRKLTNFTDQVPDKK